MRFAFSHANTSAEMMTPISTASARLCSSTVMPATKKPTRLSRVGILPIALILAHSKVPMATIIISPVRAAIGIFSMYSAPNMMNTSSITEATMPDRRARAPEEMLMRLWPIMAQPPMPEKNPVTTLARPCAIASLLLLPRVSVISSMRFSVSRLSIRPTPATINA